MEGKVESYEFIHGRTSMEGQYEYSGGVLSNGGFEAEPLGGN
jgi:hypothetical protein